MDSSLIFIKKGDEFIPLTDYNETVPKEDGLVVIHFDFYREVLELRKMFKNLVGFVLSKSLLEIGKSTKEYVQRRLLQ